MFDTNLLSEIIAAIISGGDWLSLLIQLIFGLFGSGTT